MSTASTHQPLTIALPKGRLLDRLLDHFGGRGISLSFEDRRLVSTDSSGELKAFLVKNNDLPTYVNHGIAGLGICGSDVLYESGYRFLNLLTFSFGKTRMCLAGAKEQIGDHNSARRLQVATKFTRFTQDYFHAKGIPVQVIKLEGSVELAPILGLAPYIVDLVETGDTLRANNLRVIDTLKEIEVHLIANASFYKLNYKRINILIDRLREPQG
ncbi:MAG TPA: ATP phosphoribosyltransferase [Spirochaetia bacterium]|nr:ATP phosphoribosyltransferase [Spirochaetia bacterium]